MLGRIGLRTGAGAASSSLLNAEYQHAAHQLGWSTEE
jgi:hypothetical protein